MQALNDREVAFSKASSPITQEIGGALDVFIEMWEERKGGRKSY